MPSSVHVQFKRCPFCSAVNALDSHYCAKCGQPLSPADYAAAPLPIWQNKNVIVIGGLAFGALAVSIVFCGLLSLISTSESPRMLTSPPVVSPSTSPSPAAAVPSNSNRAAKKSVPSPSAQVSPKPDDSEMSADRKTYPGNTTYTQPSSSGRTYITGPRGGCYYINSSGNKTYVDHSFCGRTSDSYSEPKSFSSQPSIPRSSGYTRGPRGGCYYISASGSKRYVDRSLCN
jgi:hypothetical protein